MLLTQILETFLGPIILRDCLARTVGGNHGDSRTFTFNWLIESTGSYPTMLDTGFGLLARLVESCGLYALEYSNLDQAIALLTRVSDEHENSDPD